MIQMNTANAVSIMKRCPLPVLIVFFAASFLAGCDFTWLQSDPGVPAENADDPIAALIKDLRASGANAAPSGTVSQPFFSVPGRLLTVNGEHVQVFAYATPDEADAEAAYIDPDGDSFKAGEMAGFMTWIGPPHFFKSDQLIVLYVGTTAATLEALERVLGSQFAGR